MRFHDLPFLCEGSRLTLGAEVTHDDVRDIRVFGLVQLRIPLGRVRGKKSRKLTSLERRMTDPVIRDIDIVSSVSLGDSVAARFSSGDVISGIVTVDAANMATDVIDAGANSVVVVDGAVNTAGIIMRSGQMLTGGGTPMTLYYLSDESSGFKSISYTPSGIRGTINGTGEDVITVVAGNNANRVNIIQNVTITGGTGDGINAILDRANIQLIDSTISGVGANGTQLDDNSILTVTNSRIENPGDSGILADANNTITLMDVAINNAGNRGLLIQDFNTGTFTDLTVDSSAVRGIQFDKDNDFTLSTVTISNTDSLEGLKVFDRNTLAITNLNVSGVVDDDALDFRDNNTISLANLNISNVSGTGNAVVINDDNTITLMDVVIDDIGGIGIGFNDNNTATITGLTLTNTGDRGIDFGNSNTVSIDGLRSSNTAREGVAFSDNTGSTPKLNVSIINSTFDSISGQEAIQIGDNYNIVINNVTIGLTSAIVNADAIRITDDSTIDISNTTIGNLSAGRFAIEVDTGNVISGSGNKVVAPFGSANVCDIGTGTTGSISFTDFDGAGTPGVCQ